MKCYLLYTVLQIAFTEVLSLILCYRLHLSQVLPVLYCVTGCAPVKCYVFYSVLQAVFQ